MRLILYSLPKQDPWERLKPFILMHIPHVDKRCLKAIFEGLVLALHRSVGGGVVGGTEGDLDVEGLHDPLEEVGNEGVPIIRTGPEWNPES